MRPSARTHACLPVCLLTPAARRWDAIWYSELGSSHTVLKAGFAIDCFMLRCACYCCGSLCRGCLWLHGQLPAPLCVSVAGTVWHCSTATPPCCRAHASLPCCLHRYQGVNWADPINHLCNGGRNPTGRRGNDGLDLDPLEVGLVSACYCGRCCHRAGGLETEQVATVQVTAAAC